MSLKAQLEESGNLEKNLYYSENLSLCLWCRENRTCSLSSIFSRADKNENKLIYSYFSNGNRNSIKVSTPVLTWGSGQLNVDPLPPEMPQKRCGVASHQVSACCAHAGKSLLVTHSSVGTSRLRLLCAACLGSARPGLWLQQHLLATPAPWPQTDPLSL